MLDLTGKTAIVTGAGSGIGKGISLAFARAGANVLAADVVGSRAQTTAEEVLEIGPQAAAFEVDVRDAHALEKMVAAARASVGATSPWRTPASAAEAASSP